jgi:hypothetical protein
MGRARVLTAIAVWALIVAPRALAQAPPEGWVVLPVDEYRSLRALAMPSGPPPASPPVEATLTRVDYDLRIDGDSVVGRALLTIDVLREGWTRVQIPAGLMLRDARLDGQPLSVVEGPPPHVLLSRAGRSLLTLDVALPLATSAGGESIALPASPSPIARTTLTLPRTGVDLAVTGGFVADRSESAAESRWTILGRPNQALTISWKRKVDDRRADQPLRIRGRVTQMIALGEDTTAIAAAVRVEVVQGLAREIVLALPPGLAINQVNGATVGDWDATATTLRVRLLDPVSTETSFVVQAEARAPRDGSIAIPLVRIPSSERETGGVAVDVVGAGEISGRQARGFEPADPSELGEIVAGRESPSMIAFRFRPLAGTDTRALTVDVVRYMPQPVLVANVEEARYRALASEDGRLLVQAKYAVRNNQRSFLNVTMPANSTLWSATVGGRPIRPGVGGGDNVLLPLEKGRAGEDAPTFAVELVYLQLVDPWPIKGRARLDLPALDLPISRTGVELHHSPRVHVDPQPGAFRIETDAGPYADALRITPAVTVSASPAPPELDTTARLQELVDRFRNEAGGRLVVGSLPVPVTFPSFGPSIFLASELTAEGRVPTIDLTIKPARN